MNKLRHQLLTFFGSDFVLYRERIVMDELEEYLRMLRPKKEDQAILFYGSQYRLWLLGKYIGTATWMHDKYLGDSFQNQVMVNGELLQYVYVADKFELVIKSRKQKPTN